VITDVMALVLINCFQCVPCFIGIFALSMGN
jgi:hypothetical protein